MAVVTWTSVWGAYLGDDPPVESYTITLYAGNGSTVLGVVNTPTLSGEVRFELYGVKAEWVTIEQGGRRWMEKIASPHMRPGEAYAMILTFNQDL
jgi:hypothetical protein